MSSPDTPRGTGWEAHNHAVQMSHSGQVQPEPLGVRKCDIRPLCAAHNADLTFAPIAGSMDDHEADKKGVFGL